MCSVNAIIEENLHLDLIFYSTLANYQRNIKRKPKKKPKKIIDNKITRRHRFHSVLTISFTTSLQVIYNATKWRFIHLRTKKDKKIVEENEKKKTITSLKHARI